MPSDSDVTEGFLDRNVGEITADLDGLGEQDLEQAIKLEQEGKNRSSLIGALEEQLAAVRGETGEPEADEGGKQARGEESPAWQKPGYSGPLTGDQALWRNQNITQKQRDDAEPEA